MPSLEDPAFASAVQENARRTIHGFIDVPIPIIAAVNGPAVGWGATLATLLLSGLLGFLINIAVFLQIKHTRYSFHRRR